MLPLVQITHGLPVAAARLRGRSAWLIGRCILRGRRPELRFVQLKLSLYRERLRVYGSGDGKVEIGLLQEELWWW